MDRTGTTLTHWGAYTVSTRDGRVTSITAAGDDPDPSPIGQQLARSHDSRVLRPSVRRSWIDDGPFSSPELRGTDTYVDVSWERALDLAAEVLDRTRTESGNEAIYGGSYGWASAGRFHHAPSQLKRFLNCIGGFTTSVGTYSHGAAEVVAPAILGVDLAQLLRLAPPLADVAEHTELLVSFGGFPASNTQITSGGDAQHWYRPQLRRAAENGCRFVSISPVRGDFDEELGAEWLPIRPGTDTALMLGLAGELVRTGAHDPSFLDTFCFGGDAVVDHLAGRSDGVERDAAWAADVCGLDVSAIRTLATDISTSRATVNATWSTQRVENGEQAVWALITLGAIVGQIAELGGGIAFGYGSMGSMGDTAPSDFLPFLSQGQNPVGVEIPVSRIADCLLSPGAEYAFNGTVRRYPDIDLIYWCGGNPFHHHQDLNRLERAWSRARTVIVNEPFWTATAQRADIVFPSTIGPERDDFGGTRVGTSLVAMEQVLEPPGDARHDYEIFGELAHRLDCHDAFTEGRTAEEWLTHFYRQIENAIPGLPDYATFRAMGIIERPPRERADRFHEFLADPVSCPLDTSSGRIQLAVDHYQALLGSTSAAHAAWNTPVEWLGSAAPDELHLVSPMPRGRLHAQYGFGDSADEPVGISTGDARRLSIESGDRVRIWNSRGECFGRARVADDVREGVVSIENGRWLPPRDPETGRFPPHANPNTLTADRPTSRWGQATAAHSCLVRIERLGP